MSDYYNSRRNRNLFDPAATEPFKVSRSKIDLFLNCPLCFYLDCRLGVGRPPGFPFALNSAVDTLLKKEFDIHRAKKRSHPLMHAYGLKDVVPFQHEDLDLWRSNFKAIRFYTQTGAIYWSPVPSTIFGLTQNETLSLSTTNQPGKKKTSVSTKSGQSVNKAQWKSINGLFPQN